MKKIILILAVVFTAGFTQAFADKSNDVNKLASTSFSKDFVNAKNVSWQQEKNYAKATFTLNEQVMYAYYSNQNGELMAVVRNILSDQLPLALMRDIRSNFSNYWISNLFELSADGQSTYYATMENSCETLILKSNGFNEWSVYAREKKQ